VKKESKKESTKIGAKPAPPFPKKEAKPTKQGSIAQMPAGTSTKPREGKQIDRVKKAAAEGRKKRSGSNAIETAALFAEKPRPAPKKNTVPAPEEPVVAPSDLKRIVKMVSELLEKKKALDEAAAVVEALTKEVGAIERDSIPTLMDEIGVSTIKLLTGQTVTVIQDCETSISKERKPKALAWLIKHGFAGLIKTAVSVSFAKGEHDSAEKVKLTISRMFPKNEVELEESVHPQTLKSFVKERQEKGEPVPTDLFGVFMFKKAVIKD
jgi:hypothetical protein